jgi:hypothetical protein
MQQLIVLYPAQSGILLAVLAVISQLAANYRVKEATETVKTWKWVQYLLTFLVFASSFLPTYQAYILHQTPTSLVIPVTIVLALIMQYASGARERAATVADNGAEENLNPVE